MSALLFLLMVGGFAAVWASNRELKRRLDMLETRLDRSPPASAPAPGGIWVQAGAWPDARQARRAADHLGASATVDVAGAGLYRVLVGPWPDTAAAERSRRAVMSRGYPEATTISGS